MITLFTTAKSFDGEARQRQFNALRSWKALHPEVEIFLFGKGSGYSQAAAELGLVWVENIATGESGCPRIDRMFAHIDQYAKHPVRAFLNCDILLLGNILDAVQRVDLTRYLMVARRVNLDLREFIVGESEWQERLTQAIRRDGQIGRPTAIDMFLYRGDVWQDLPPLVVGRAGYDNFLVYHCRLNRVPVVNASDTVTLVHQNHDYSHVAGGVQEVWNDSDALRNYDATGSRDRLFSILDADWRLTGKGLCRTRCDGDWRRHALTSRRLRMDRQERLCGLGGLIIEVWQELYFRWIEARNGNWGLLTKFPAWAMLRLLGIR